jgi:hypothetical protein
MLFFPLNGHILVMELDIKTILKIESNLVDRNEKFQTQPKLEEKKM